MGTSEDIVRDRKAKQAIASQGWGMARFKSLDDEAKVALASCNPNSRESILRIVAECDERNKATVDPPKKKTVVGDIKDKFQKSKPQR